MDNIFGGIVVVIIVVAIVLGLGLCIKQCSEEPEYSSGIITRIVSSDRGNVYCIKHYVDGSPVYMMYQVSPYSPPLGDVGDSVSVVNKNNDGVGWKIHMR